MKFRKIRTRILPNGEALVRIQTDEPFDPSIHSLLYKAQVSGVNNTGEASLQAVSSTVGEPSFFRFPWRGAVEYEILPDNTFTAKIPFPFKATLLRLSPVGTEEGLDTKMVDLLTWKPPEPHNEVEVVQDKNGAILVIIPPSVDFDKVKSQEQAKFTNKDNTEVALWCSAGAVRSGGFSLPLSPKAYSSSNVLFVPAYIETGNLEETPEELLFWVQIAGQWSYFPAHYDKNTSRVTIEESEFVKKYLGYVKEHQFILANFINH